MILSIGVIATITGSIIFLFNHNSEIAFYALVIGLFGLLIGTHWSI